jgi:hypothetical protein
LSLFASENYDLKEVFLTKLTQFSQGNNVLMLLFLRHMVFFRDTCVLQHSRIGLFGTK